MNPPLESLRGLYQRNHVMRAVVDALEALRASEDETEVTKLVPLVNKGKVEIVYNEVVGALRDLEKRTCGRFIVGRKGGKSRMKWRVDTKRLRAALSGELDELPVLDMLEDVDMTDAHRVASSPPPRLVAPDGEELVTHTFNLRRDFPVQFELPSSLTRSEAERLAKFIESLPFE